MSTTTVGRAATATLQRMGRTFRVLAVTGPRQSGKTTLVRHAFPDKPFVSLEDPDRLEHLRSDARGFFAGFPDGAILDEAHRFPDLFSWLQGIVDEARRPGMFVLTGSQHFGLMKGLRQSLAGRVGLLHLLPFSLGELQRAKKRVATLDDLLWRGLYPPIRAGGADPVLWLNSYIATYVERDVRGLLDVQDLPGFLRFVRVCAGHVGQLVNLSKLGAACGITHPTARAWLDVLEASYLVFRLQPHFTNFKKRLTKTPKLYFHDTGLAARLVGIESEQHLATHPLRGALFENWVLTELMKARFARGQDAPFYFWRADSGLEVDVVVERGQKLHPIEVKSGATVASDWFTALQKWRDLAKGKAGPAWLVYGGDEARQQHDTEVVPWRALPDLTAD